MSSTMQETVLEAKTQVLKRVLSQRHKNMSSLILKTVLKQWNDYIYL